MADLSYYLSKGQEDQPLDIGVGTNAPGSGDVELRINGAATGGTGGSGVITTKEIVLILQAFIRRLETQQGQADLGNI
jgi:hypothetical protein